MFDDKVCDMCLRNHSICEANRHSGSWMASKHQLLVSDIQWFCSWLNIPWWAHHGHR